MDMGKIVKKSVEKQDMLAWQFNTIGVSDGITMGSEGRSAHSPWPKPPV
jgi:dihydroxy-acid dehydratase